jgi:hypothetical protein
MRVSTVGVTTIGSYFPWYISGPVKVATVVTTMGGPGESWKGACLRVGSVAATILVSSYVFGDVFTTAVTMFGVDLLLASRNETVEKNQIKETTIVEDTVDFVKNRDEKMDKLWKGVEKKKIEWIPSETQKNEGVSINETKKDEDTTLDKITYWTTTLFCAIAEFTEEMYGTNKYSETKEKTE